MSPLKSRIEQAEKIIKFHEDRIKLFTDEPDILSDEPTMGGLVKSSALIDRHEKAIKNWKKELRILKKRQAEFDKQ